MLEQPLAADRGTAESDIPPPRAQQEPQPARDETDSGHDGKHVEHAPPQWAHRADARCVASLPVQMERFKVNRERKMLSHAVVRVNGRADIPRGRLLRADDRAAGAIVCTRSCVTARSRSTRSSAPTTR